VSSSDTGDCKKTQEINIEIGREKRRSKYCKNDKLTRTRTVENEGKMRRKPKKTQATKKSSETQNQTSRGNINKKSQKPDL
jgi:hypothetical protein